MNFQPPDPPEEDEGERWERHLLAVEAENEQMKKRLLVVDIVHGPKAEMRWAALEAENTELRKDAERYRWLRDKSESVHQFYLSTPIWFSSVKFSKANVDSTIDAAMGNGEQP